MLHGGPFPARLSHPPGTLSPPADQDFALDPEARQCAGPFALLRLSGSNGGDAIHDGVKVGVFYGYADRVDPRRADGRPAFLPFGAEAVENWECARGPCGRNRPLPAYLARGVAV